MSQSHDIFNIVGFSLNDFVLNLNKSLKFIHTVVQAVSCLCNLRQLILNFVWVGFYGDKRFPKGNQRAVLAIGQEIFSPMGTA